jgi:hypothetical protein
MRPQNAKHSPRQCGVASVEFALIAVIFFSLLFGIIEFGRLLFSINSVQEVTRRAAREQAVRWVTDSTAVQREAVLQPDGGGNFPGIPDIDNTKVQLGFYNTYANAVSGTNPVEGVGDPLENFNNCYWGLPNCIRFIRATLTETDGSPVRFNSIVPFMSDSFVLPRSTVIMPAEALGLV